MIKILTSNWMALPVSAIIYTTATVAFWKTPAVSKQREVTGQKGQSGASWDFKNPEADQLMAELREEKKGVEKKERDLKELEQRLEAERAEVTQVTESVNKMQKEFDQNVLRIQEEETANLKKLAKVYSTMTPEGAAGIFGDMDDPSVAKILVFMKETDTAAILEALSKKGGTEAKRAAALSERLRLASFRNPGAK
jgi:flagellar motility protein MotE (MotC chaperone)